MKNNKNTKKKKSPRATLTAETADKHILYENSVQNTEATIEVIESIYRHERRRLPRAFREDFCGTAKLCADWVCGHKGRKAVGVDIDPPTLKWAAEHNIAPLTGREKARVTLLESDVLDCDARDFDVVAAFNFSYWIFKERATLKRYFENVYSSLKGDGLFLLDIYGGPDSQFVMEEETDHGTFTYVWDQAEMDPINNHIVCRIHYRFKDGSEMHDAFTYDWRLWSMPELRDLLEEVGFKKIVAWWDCEDDLLRPKKSVENLISWVAYLAAWR
jgi:SAM-dependent methyltransferase